jgi:hypothetical protein
LQIRGFSAILHPQAKGTAAGTSRLENRQGLRFAAVEYTVQG